MIKILSTYYTVHGGKQHTTDILGLICQNQLSVIWFMLNNKAFVTHWLPLHKSRCCILLSFLFFFFLLFGAGDWTQGHALYHWAKSPTPCFIFKTHMNNIMVVFTSSFACVALRFNLVYESQTLLFICERISSLSYMCGITLVVQIAAR